ncbi:GIY-YIG nuclease family protein [Pantoea sp.]|uniref:GIY-YIG nuclease family protein n=1 Tax=Pantoea sp. TaxID=69393 RepID=UPI0028ADE084|nr:GIY-YIG nuclease family protein [Pantoea sp.]
MSFTISKVKAQEIRDKLVDDILHLDKHPVLTMPIPEDFRLDGWVYVLSNVAMPGIFKIGMTTSTPEVRAKEVSQGTGVPMPYVVEHAFHSDKPKEDEAAIHESLTEYRLNPNREFFMCEEAIILDAFEGQGLVNRDTNVECLADKFNVIALHKKKTLNLFHLYEEMGIETFGDHLAIAEGLIRFACREVKRQSFEGYSLLFSEGKVQRVKQEITQQYEAYLASHPEKTSETGIYHSPF